MAKKEIHFWRADDVRDIAEELIPQFFEHLADETIVYVFRSEAAEKKGRTVLGAVRKVGGINAYLAFRNQIEDLNARARQGDAPATAKSFYVVEIPHDIWSRMDSSERIALVDNELCKITPDGVVGPDCEVFHDNVARHGLWTARLKDLAKTIRETPLFDAIEAMRPSPESGIESVTLTVGDVSATLYPKDVH